MSDVGGRGPAWLVLPTYNEAGNVELLVEAAISNLPSAARILIVDDDSPDGTGRIADRLAAEHPAVEVLHRTR
ncbi:MAG TPA: glycosyltransferase, partial [Solirubrobacterales bacterium]|nr:glycosyltransferase [Solirubrobacterales bacterium]